MTLTFNTQNTSLAQHVGYIYKLSGLCLGGTLTVIAPVFIRSFRLECSNSKHPTVVLA